MLKIVSWLLIAIITLAIVGGLLGAVLPAFGWSLLEGSNTFTLQSWRDLFAQPGLQRSVFVSFASGLAAALISLTAVFLFIAGWHDTKLFRWLHRLLSPLLAVPHAAAAAGLIFLISPSGLIVRAFLAPILNWQQPPDVLIVNDNRGLAMMVGLIIKEIPFLLLMSLAALPQIGAGPRMQMARSLGYGPVCGWLKAVAPGLYPLLRLPVYAVIGYASSVVDVALILGPSNPPVLAVQIVRWMNEPDLSLRPMAAAGALLQLGVTLAALLLWLMGELVVRKAMTVWAVSGMRRCADRVLSLISAIIMTAAAALVILGLVALAVAAFARSWRYPNLLPQSWTLDIWLQTLSGLRGPLLSTLIVGVCSTILALLAAIAALENEWRRNRPAGLGALWLLYAPLIIPQVVFLFSFAVAAESSGLAPTASLVVLGHLLFVFPYVYLSLSQPYRRLDRRWSMTAQSLGAGVNRVFWSVRLPMLLAPCLTAAALGFAVSVGLYLPTLLLGAGRVSTITTEAVALAASGDRRSIGAWAMLQTMLPGIAFAVALAGPRLAWQNRRVMREFG